MNLAALLDDDQEKIVDAEPLPAATVLSLASVKNQFKQYMDKVDSMVGDAQAIQITDAETLNIAVMMGGNAKKITKSIDAKKKEVTAEANDFVKSVNGFCKMFTDKLVEVEIGLKKKITAYQTKIELDRRKQEELAKKAAEKLQKQINEEAKSAGVEAPLVPAPVIPKQETVTRTETGTSSYQVKTWKCYVERPELVPREFCAPDGRLLNNAVKQGIREIAGCRIVEESDTRFRT